MTTMQWFSNQANAWRTPWSADQWQQAWKLPSTALFALDSSFWGHKGVPPCQRHPQIPSLTQTSMPNLDPFLPPFKTFEQQTTIKH